MTDTWSNPLSDEVLEEARYTMDSAARAKLYQEAQEVIIDELPVVPLYSPLGFSAAKKRVTGLKWSEDDILFLNDVDIE